MIEFVVGVLLATFWKEPTKTGRDEVVLAEDVDDEKLDFVYEQLVEYLVQLSRLIPWRPELQRKLGRRVLGVLLGGL
jgi:hypothetical protein